MEIFKPKKENKLKTRKFFDILFIIYFFGIPIILLETYALNFLQSLGNIYLTIVILWFIISTYLLIRILIIQAKLKRWGWFVSTIIFGPIALPIFYFAGYRKYLSGKENIKEIL